MQSPVLVVADAATGKPVLDPALVDMGFKTPTATGILDAADIEKAPTFTALATK